MSSLTSLRRGWVTLLHLEFRSLALGLGFFTNIALAIDLLHLSTHVPNPIVSYDATVFAALVLVFSPLLAWKAWPFARSIR